MSKKINGLYTVHDIRNAVVDLYSGNTSQPFDVGFEPLEDLYKVSRGTFHVWTGVPNHGKSSFLADIIMQMAKLHNWKFCIFSPEHSMANNIKRLVEKFMLKPFDYGMEGRVSKEELGKSLTFINEHFYFIDMENESPDIHWILNVARQAKEVYEIDGLVIDPYNEINPTRKSSLREDEHISTVISDIKRFNRETECVTWLVAHPKKMQRQEDGTYQVDSYDISGSAHFANKADLIVNINRIFNPEKTLFQIKKVREADLYGAIGEAEFKWNSSTRCFHPLNITKWDK
jgi:twinkle protein|tara:strand:- start:518 stop:1381 length:864 start_codon:yes stop_codon:yes gene_type:complete